MGNIDWGKPIEYVDEYGCVFPAELVRVLKNVSDPYLVVITYGDKESARFFYPDGKYTSGSDNRHVRNIPEPKREPLTLWIPVNGQRFDRNEARTFRPAGDTLVSGWVWRKFVEVVEP